MTCTYAGQLIMGGCLHIRLKAYQQVAITRAVALVPAMAVALSATFSGDYNLFNEINEFLNILQSIQLPFAMLPVLHFASSADLLGRRPAPPTSSAFRVCLRFRFLRVAPSAFAFASAFFASLSLRFSVVL